MSAIEPGEEFEIEYGNGHKLTVVALDLRSKNKIAKLMASAAGNADAFGLLEQAVSLCCPGINDEQWSKIDERLAGEIIGKTLSNAALNASEKKEFV